MDTGRHNLSGLTLEKAAERLVGAVCAARDTGAAPLVVWSGGSSPRRLVPRLLAYELDWSDVSFLLSDERWVAPSSVESNEGEMRRYLAGTAMEQAQIVGLYREGMSVTEAAWHLNAEIGRFLERPACLSVIGIGSDGHIASLFPHREWVGVRAGRFVVADREGAGGYPRISLTPDALRRSAGWLVFVNTADKRMRWHEARAGARPEDLPAAIAFSSNTPPVATVTE